MECGATQAIPRAPASAAEEDPGGEREGDLRCRVDRSAQGECGCGKTTPLGVCLLYAFVLFLDQFAVLVLNVSRLFCKLHSRTQPHTELTEYKWFRKVYNFRVCRKFFGLVSLSMCIMWSKIWLFGVLQASTMSTIVKQHTASASYVMEHTGSVLVWLPRPSHLRGRVWYH